MTMKDLSGSSKSSFASIRVSLDTALKGKGAKECEVVASDLFAVVSALDSSSGLRRAVTDPARDGGAKAHLVQDLFGKVISPSTLSLIESAVSLRWSTPSDLSDAIERLAVEALAASAESGGEIDRVEEELFAISRLLASESELRSNLNDGKFTQDAKGALLRSIFASVISSSSEKVLDAIVAGRRGRSFERTIAFYANTFVARKERTIARVTSAVPLGDKQRARLAETLERHFGRKIRVDVTVDRAVLGGISVRIGDELIDGTVISRLVDASRALAGRQLAGKS